MSTPPTSTRRPRCQWVSNLAKPCGYRLPKNSKSIYCGPHLALYLEAQAAWARRAPPSTGWEE